MQVPNQLGSLGKPPALDSVAPAFASLDGTAMRLSKNGENYWRDAGAWGVQWRIDRNDVIRSVKPDMHCLHDVELVPITREDYLAQNEGYVREVI